MFSSNYIPRSSLGVRDIGDIDTTVYTTDGTPVDALIREEFSPTEVSSLQSTIENNYSDLEFIAPPSRLYNCHSYAWFNRSDTNTYWISFSGKFILDKHTVSVGQDELQSGDIVVYIAEGDYAHSAVVEYISEDGTVYCISKWGYYGLYGHAIDNVPNSYKENDEIDVVYYRYEHGWHNYSTFSTGNNYHLLECSVCSLFTSEPHSKYYSSINSNTHTISCYYCSYSQTIAHIFEYTDINISMHKATCRICDYSRNEAHTANEDRTQCLYCLRKGNFIGMVPNKKREDTDVF